MLHYTIHVGVEPGSVPPDLIGGMLKSRFMVGQEIAAIDTETGQRYVSTIDKAKVCFVAMAVQTVEKEKQCESQS